MNREQLVRLTQIAQTGADYARAGNGLMAMDTESMLGGWWQCANHSRDRDTARAARRAIKWVQCARDYHAGYAHPITEAATQLMWGDEA